MNYLQTMIKKLVLIFTGLILVVAYHYLAHPPMISQLKTIVGNEKSTDLGDAFVELNGNMFHKPSLKLRQNESGDFVTIDSQLNFLTSRLQDQEAVGTIAKDHPNFFKNLIHPSTVRIAEPLVLWSDMQRVDFNLNQNRFRILNLETKQVIDKKVPVIDMSNYQKEWIYLISSQVRVHQGKVYVLNQYAYDPDFNKFEETSDPNESGSMIEIFELDPSKANADFKLINSESIKYSEELEYSEDLWYIDAEQDQPCTIDAPYIMTTYDHLNDEKGSFKFFNFKTHKWEELKVPDTTIQSRSILAADSEKMYFLEYDEQSVYLGHLTFNEGKYQGSLPIENFEGATHNIIINCIGMDNNGLATLVFNNQGKINFGQYHLNTGQTQSLYTTELPKEYQKQVSFYHHPSPHMD